jgi:hypothetical protein
VDVFFALLEMLPADFLSTNLREHDSWQPDLFLLLRPFYTEHPPLVAHAWLSNRCCSPHPTRARAAVAHATLYAEANVFDCGL